MSLATSLIFIWPGTNASIPAGWVRETTLDDLYPMGYTDAGSYDGAVGALDGATEHQHQIWFCVHTFTAGASSDTSTLTVSGTKNAAASAGHTHGSAKVFGAWGWSGNCDNAPPHIAVIYIKPDGTGRQGIPPGAWSYHAGAAIPGGWSAPAQAKGTFLCGAADGANSNLTVSGSSVHAHAGSHSHAASTSAACATGTASLYPAGTGVAAVKVHSHAVTWNPVDPGMTTSATDPGWEKLSVLQNDAEGERMASDLVALYLGQLVDIPDDWELYQLAVGYALLKGATTPGEVGDIGGSDLSGVHYHTSTAHGHDAIGVAMNQGGCGSAGSGAAVAAVDHSAVWSTSPEIDTVSGTWGLDYPPCIYAGLLRYIGIVIDLAVATGASHALAIVVTPGAASMTLDAPASVVTSAPTILISAETVIVLTCASLATHAPVLSVDVQQGAAVLVTLTPAAAVVLTGSVSVLASTSLVLAPASSSSSACLLVVAPDPAVLALLAAVGAVSAGDIRVRLPDAVAIGSLRWAPAGVEDRICSAAPDAARVAGVLKETRVTPVSVVSRSGVLPGMERGSG